jgi:hypothetical protein
LWPRIVDPYPSHAASYVTLCIRLSSRPIQKEPPFGAVTKWLMIFNRAVQI